jgi:glycerol-3-phosphate cytidylyltransferase-like family protein
MAESTETTMAGKEMYAKAHPDYIAILLGIKQAIEQEETLKWELISAQATIEIYRTESANNRSIDKALQ